MSSSNCSPKSPGSALGGVGSTALPGGGPAVQAVCKQAATHGGYVTLHPAVGAHTPAQRLMPATPSGAMPLLCLRPLTCCVCMLCCRSTHLYLLQRDCCRLCSSHCCRAVHQLLAAACQAGQLLGQVASQGCCLQVCSQKQQCLEQGQTGVGDTPIAMESDVAQCRDMACCWALHVAHPHLLLPQFCQRGRVALTTCRHQDSSNSARCLSVQPRQMQQNVHCT